MSVLNYYPNYPTVSASGSLNFTPLYNIYYFSPTTTGIAYTYTLPAIVCDGMKFKVVRNDSDTTTTLTVTGTGNNIFYGGTTSASIVIEIQRSVAFISYNGIWYTSRNIGRTAGVSSSIFSGNFTANNGTPFLQMQGNGSTPTAFSSFSYLGTGTYGEIVTGGATALRYVSGSPTVQLSLFQYAQSSPIATSTSQLISADITIPFTSIFQNLLSTGPSVLQMFISISGGGGNKIGVYGFVVY